MANLFSLPNCITGLNLISGVVSIIFAFAGRLELAVAAIFIGAIFDFFDGMVARITNQQGELGKQLDSLADIVTFGVAPGVLVFILLIISGVVDQLLVLELPISELWKEGTMGYSVQYWVAVFLNQIAGNQHPEYPAFFSLWQLVLPFGALLIPFFSLFRLAKFNIDTRQSESFIGLPTPANSIFFASFALMLWDGFGAENWKSALSLTLIKDQVLMTFVIVFSVLLVSEIPLLSLKFKSFGWKGNEVRFSFLLLSLFLLSILWVWAVPLIILCYILISLVVKKK